jgi:hypothetical protein
MMRTTVFLFAAALGVAGPGVAQETSVNAQITKSVETFESVCLAAAPGFPKDTKAFASRGYVNATKDPAVLGNAENGFAGLGYAPIEGDPTTSPTTNGCLVYFKGLDADGAATLLDTAMARRFKILERSKIDRDTYWVIRDFSPRRFVAFVAPKPDGNYAGHTLLMIAEHKPAQTKTEKALPVTPKDPAQAAELLEQMRRMSPEERIATFGALQFTQCLLATDFLAIEFDKEIGVERVQSSVAGENQFMDSATGNMMMTTAKQCIVAYHGTNVEVALEGIKPTLSLRDKNAQGSAHDNGYVIKLNMKGRPHVVTIARGQIQGRNLVRMMLAEDVPQ